MNKVIERPIPDDLRDDEFVVNGRYLREQAGEAIAIFLAPLSGVYRAATGARTAKKVRQNRATKKAA